MDRAKVGHLHDSLYVLEAACDDVRQDLEAENPDLRAALAHVLTAADSLRDAYLEPKADLLA